jgi:hypothetical protein
MSESTATSVLATDVQATTSIARRGKREEVKVREPSRCFFREEERRTESGERERRDGRKSERTGWEGCAAELQSESKSRCTGTGNGTREAEGRKRTSEVVAVEVVESPPP